MDARIDAKPPVADHLIKITETVAPIPAYRTNDPSESPRLFALEAEETADDLDDFAASPVATISVVRWSSQRVSVRHCLPDQSLLKSV